MIHPLKAATSFECDGCGHHASFHKMENQEEDEITRRWKLERAEKAEGDQQRFSTNGEDVDAMVFARQAPKRRRIIDLSALEIEDIVKANKRNRERRG